MKSTSTKSGLILIFIILFFTVLDLGAQVTLNRNNSKQIIEELENERKENSLSSSCQFKKLPAFLFSEKVESFSLKRNSKIQQPFSFQDFLSSPTDSGYIYGWEDKDWFLSGRFFYYLNATGYEIIQEKRIDGSDEWVKAFKSEYIYYESNELKKRIFSFWKESTKEWIIDELYEYNESGLETEYYFKVWNDTTQKFTYGERVTSIYENETNIVENTAQEWDTVANSWSFVLKYENDYDNDLLISSVEKIYAKTGSWANSYSWSFEYEFGDPTKQIGQYWDTILNDWINDFNYVISYNEIGNKTQERLQIWDTISSHWVNSDSLSIAYNNSLNIESEINKIWDSNTDTWVDTTKISYTYTEIELDSTILYEVWNGTAWESTFLEMYEYDELGRLTDVSLEEWEHENQEWKNYVRFSYTYDSEGYKETEKHDIWNSITNEWETGYSDKWTFTADLVYRDEYSRAWSDSLNKFINGTRELTTLYPTGYPKEYTYQIWDTNDVSWVNNYKTVYYWDPALPAEQIEYDEISIYPTPFRSNLNIELNENINSAEITLYNIQGQKIDEYFFDKKVNSIDLSRLKNGVYFIVYVANNRKFVKKIVKQ